MDGSRFDGITRTLATAQTRRRALLGLTGGALAGVLGLTRVEEAAAGCVKPGKKGCKGPKNKKCCAGSVCQGGSKDKEGRCKCRGGTKQCGTKCVNTKTDSNNCGKCKNTCKGRNTCKNGTCTSKNGCKAGFNICNESEPVGDFDDPRICGGDGTLSGLCFCVTDFNGVAYCSNAVQGDCADCESNGDCPDGFVCVDSRGPGCECDQNPDSNGNGCVPATCEGVSGSSAGRGRLLRTPLLR